MLFPDHEAAQWSVRIERWNLPRIHVLLDSLDPFFHQRPHRLRYTLRLPRVLHIIINPYPRLFPLNRRHWLLTSSCAILFFRSPLPFLAPALSRALVGHTKTPEGMVGEKSRSGSRH